MTDDHAFQLFADGEWVGDADTLADARGAARHMVTDGEAVAVRVHGPKSEWLCTAQLSDDEVVWTTTDFMKGYE